MLSPRQLEDIGFDYVAERLAPWSPFGEELARRLSPYADADALRAELGNVALLSGAYSADPAAFGPVARALMQLKDVRRSLSRSRETTLSDIELFEVKRFLILAEALDKACAALPVVGRLAFIRIFNMNEALAILDPDGMRAQTFRLSDSCSPELASIRARRKETDIALRGAENGAERDRLTAERTRLAALEENEEMRLRGIMTREFSAHAARAEELIKSIARLDLALAKARLAAELGGVIPEIAENGGRIRYSGMFDPKLRALLREQGGDFTPVSLELDLGPTVITGANMGGKSVAVRAAALNAYLAVCGMPVFAQSLTLPHIPDIFLLAEDAEDARGGLSSFGGEMIRFDGILKEIAKKPGALVLIDEFARGTNPHEGAALVRAAVRYFNEKKTAFALITTHFDDVACLAPVHYQVMGLRRADEEELTRALSAAGTAGEGKAGGTDPRRRLLAKYMDYGLFRADGASNPPRDALKICRALRISDEFMSFVRE